MTMSNEQVLKTLDILSSVTECLIVVLRSHLITSEPNLNHSPREVERSFAAKSFQTLDL